MSAMGDRMYETVIGILRLWALEYPQQATVFPDSGMLWSEYMSAADNLILYIPTVIEEGKFPLPAVVSAVRAYNRVISLPDVEPGETPERYFNRRDFYVVRELSQEALRALDEELKLPDIGTF